MKTKILTGIALIGLALAIFSSNGVAYFSDIEKSTGNEITAGESIPTDFCRFLGKLEYDEKSGLFSVEDDDLNDLNIDDNTFLLAPNDDSGDEVVITITPKETKNEDGKTEVLTFDFVVESGKPICGTEIKAALDEEYTEFPCVFSGEGLTPSYGNTPQHGISYIKFYYCACYVLN